MKTLTAKGTKGFLLRSFNNRCIFRTYNEQGEFKDYDILHHDLEITIDSDDALLFEDRDNNFIDYTPEVLGYK